MQEKNNLGLSYCVAGGVIGVGMSTLFPPLLIPSAAVIGSSLFLHAYDKIFKDDNKMWKNIGLVTKDEKVPVCIKTIKTDVGEQKIYHIPDGLSFNDIHAKKDKIENAVKSKIKLELADNFNLIVTKLSSKYKDVYKIDLKESLIDGMKFNLGVNLSGKPIILDLSGTECHTGVFGSTGSGKSVCMNVLMCQFILKDLCISVIDLKAVEFSMYRRYNKLMDLAITPDDATDVLLKMVNTMENRYKKLMEAECKNYKDYNKKHNNSMSPIILIIDEYNALIDKEYKTAQKALFALLSRARACNILCIISTQRPSHEVLPGTIKCNIKNFITFKVEQEVDSEIVLSQKGNYRAFTDLKCEGEGLLKTRGTITEFKGYYLSDQEILQQIGYKLTGSIKHRQQKATIKTTKATKEDIKQISLI